MTVIVWDGVSIASDKMVCNGSTAQAVTKIFRIGSELMGLTGNLSIGMEMIEWYREGAQPEKYPTSNRTEDKGCSLIVIKGPRNVWKYESSPYPFLFEAKYCAFGSGDQVALGALYMGATAAEAVQAAIIYESNCGCGIDELKFEE